MPGCRNQLLGGRTLADGVNRWPRPTKWLWLEDRLFDLVVAPGVAEARFGPRPVHDAEPFVGPRVAVVMLLEVDSVTPRFVLPPRRDDVESETAARDVIDVRRRLGENRRFVRSWMPSGHQIQ